MGAMAPTMFASENKNLKDLEQAQHNSRRINNKARQLPNFQMSNWYAHKQSHRSHKHFPSKWQLVRILLSCSQVITTLIVVSPVLD